MKIIRKVLGGFCILEACGGVIAAIAVPEPGLLSITAVFGLLAWLCFRKPKSKGLPNQEQQVRSAQAESFTEPVFISSFAPQEVPADVLRDMRKYYRKPQARDDIRIMSESFHLCQHTYDYDVFFSRTKMVQRCAYTLLQAKKAKCRCGINKQVISTCETVLSSITALKVDFLDRTCSQEIKGAMQLKTQKGQCNRLRKYIQVLQEHEAEFWEVEDTYNSVLSRVESLIQEIDEAEVAGIKI